MTCNGKPDVSSSRVLAGRNGRTELLGALRVEGGQFGIVPQLGKTCESGLDRMAEHLVNLGKGLIPHAVDKAGMRLDPVTDLLTVQGGVMQPDLKGAMLVVGVKIDPSVTIETGGKRLPTLHVGNPVKIDTIPSGGLAVMIVAPGRADKGGPSLIGPMIGIGHGLQLRGTEVPNVKVGMEATFGVNREIVAHGKSAELVDGVKTGVGGKDGRNELLAANTGILLCAENGPTLQILIIGTGGRFKLHPKRPARSD